MLEVIALLTYSAVLIFTLYYVIRAFKTSHHELREEVVEFRRDILARVVITYKVITGFTRSPLLVLALLMLSACMVLSALSAQYGLAASSINVDGTDIYAVYVGFKELLPLSGVNRYLSEFRYADVNIYIRYVLKHGLELSLNGEKLTAYALVGIPTNMSKHFLADISISDDMLVICCNRSYGRVITLGGINYKVASADPKTVIDAMIFYGIPLLPVEAYLGTKPVVVPPDKVLIGTVPTISKIVNSSELTLTDLVMRFSKEDLERANLTALNELVRRYGGVVEVLRNNTLEILSGYGVPTAESMVSALISAIISSIILLTTFTALQPTVKSAYSRLSSVGIQPWNFTTMLTIFTTLTISAVGILMTAVINQVFGMYSAINSFITFVISAIVTAFFINRKLFNVSTVEVVPTPISNKFNLIVRHPNLCEVFNYISNIIKNDEFFELEDLDMRCDTFDGFLHASCRFRNSWGIGVDLDLFAGKYGGEGVELSFNISTWSIEELSEKQLESVLRLFESKILGGVKVWILVKGT